MVKGIPITALLNDNKLQGEQEIPEGSITGSFLKSRQEIAKICRLKNTSKIMRQCAYDSDFTPNKTDGRFKTWITKGLTSYYSFVHKGVFQSFETLQKDHGLGQDDFFRYLQVRHYFNKNIKEALGKDEPGFMEVFLALTKSRTCNKIISKLQGNPNPNAIQLSKQENTEYIKRKWETEIGVKISQESWENICQLQWFSTGSNTWREFCLKNITRFFITPIQKRHQGSGDACWRLCGSIGANHFHIFWDCQAMRSYWEEIHKHINNVFNVNIPLKCETLFLGNILFETWNIKDKKLLAILLAASKKCVTRKWLTWTLPPLMNGLKFCMRFMLWKRSLFPSRSRKTFFIRPGPNGLSM